MDGCGWNPIAPAVISLCTTQNHSLFLPPWTPASSSPSSSRPASNGGMEALAVASPVAARPQPRRRCLAAGSSCQMKTSQLHTSFSGVTVQVQKPLSPMVSPPRSSSVVAMLSRPSIQFIQGTDEQTIPDVRLTKSRDGSNGVAIFTFEQPSVFDSSAELGDITGFYMIDEEGTLSSVDVSAKFVNGKPAAVEAKYVMRTPRDWDRFMRFMERYSQANGLQFLKK